MTLLRENLEPELYAKACTLLTAAGEGSRLLDGYIAVALGWTHYELERALDQYLAEDPEAVWTTFGDAWAMPGDVHYADVYNSEGRGLAETEEATGRWEFPHITTDINEATKFLERYELEWGLTSAGIAHVGKATHPALSRGNVRSRAVRKGQPCLALAEALMMHLSQYL